MKKYLLDLVIGDSYTDKCGQENTIGFKIKSNFTKEKLLESYESGCDYLGFDPRKVIYDNYGFITQSYIKKIKSQKYTDMVGFIYEYTNDVAITEEKFFKLFVWIVKLGDSSFEFEEVKDLFQVVYIDSTNQY